MKGRKEIEIKGSRLFLIHTIGNIESSRVDVTAVWHFFKEVNEFVASEALKEEPNIPL